MVEKPDRNNQTAAIIVIAIVVILLALIVVLALQFINVSVVDPEITEPRVETEHVPALPPEIEDDPEPPAIVDIQDEVRLTIEEFISPISVQGDGLYYSYTDWNVIAVVRVSTDGAETQRTEIEWESWGPWISAFEVTHDGYFLFLLHDFDDDEAVYYFVRYNTSDSTLTYQNISDQLSLDMNTVWIHTAAFDTEGNVFLHMPDEDTIYILDRNGIYRGYVDLGDFWVAEAFQARDGQVILLGRDENFDLALKGINLETNLLTRVTTFDSSLMWLWGAYSGQHSTAFDLFLDFEYGDAYGLFGYNIATRELTFLFDWEEIEILPDWDNDIVFLEDGLVAVLQNHSTRQRFWSELIIFTP